MKENHVLSFEEYEQLDEGLKSGIAKAVAGVALAAGLNGEAVAGEEPVYKSADHKADTIGTTYTPRDIRKYQGERAFADYNQYRKYEADKTKNTPVPYYDRRSKELGLATVYTGHYQKKFNEDFFFDMSENNYTSLGLGFASKPLMDAYERCRNGRSDIDDATLNFKIIRRAGTKSAVALNDKLGIAVTIKNIDQFMPKLTQYYDVTPIGDSYGDEVFKDKGDNVEWFNISPKPSRRMRK